MTDYQNYWNQEIRNLLDELDAPASLHTNIVDTLANSQRTGIFENQIINALRLGLSIKEGNQNIAFVASMQSGKSKTIYFLCNYVLPAIGLLSGHENVLFVTSMRDTDLYNQNNRNLEADFYDASEGQMKYSRIKVIKMNEFFNYPNPFKAVRDLKVQLIVRDEDQYGCGEESSFQFAFFDNLRSKLPEIGLVAVSATPYDILDAHFTKSADIDVVEGVRPPSYFGITEMLRENMIDDLPLDFSPLQDNNGEYVVHPNVIEYVQHLLSFDDGLGIIRESTTLRALELRNLLRTKLKDNVDVLVIGSDSACDFSINEGLSEVANLIMRMGRRVILIIVQALTAGKDLGKLKEKIRFGIEPRDKQLANGAQGIAGRCCGYHNNRTFRIMASIPLLGNYAKFEQDWEIFSDPEWKEELIDNSIRGLTTQTKFAITQVEGIFTSIDDIFTVSVEELSTEEGRNKLSFLSDEVFDRLDGLFDPNAYNGSTKGTRLNAKDVTVRIASSYYMKSNRVYKNWNADLSADFGSVFFKKNDYNYGLLISNFPVEDDRNKLGFCGIKVFVSGEKVFRERESEIVNTSMYNAD